MNNKMGIQPRPQVKGTSFWKRALLWAKKHRPFCWLAVLTIILILFFELVSPNLLNRIRNALISHPILTGMVLIFSLTAISLVWTAGQRLDSWIFLLFNIRGTRPLWLDRLMLVFTQLGNGVTSLAIALVWFLSGRYVLAYELILGTLTLWLAVEFIKALAHRSRPFILLTQARIVGYRARGRSFPSGHTSQSFFLATLMIQHFHLSFWAAFIFYAVAFLVGITRMYVGAHYPRDVLAGAILGSAWGLLGVIVDVYIFG